MASRKDGGIKLGAGPRVPRTTHLADLSGKKTRHEHIQEIELFPAIVSPDPYPGRDYRAFYERNVHEILLVTGWGGFAQTAIVFLEAWPPWEKMFSVEFLYASVRVSEKYRLDIARLFPSRLESGTCQRAHRCAILDVASENLYRERPQTPSKGNDRLAVEVLLEERCDCFWDGDRKHEATLFTYGW